MKILILSDSHRAMKNVNRVLDELKDKIDVVIHLGDVLDDVDSIKLSYPNLKIINVAGNCDYGAMVETQKTFELGGKRFFITHGHAYSVKSSLTRLAYAAMENNADICLYGHTHYPIITNYENMVIMNPGSISSPRGITICSYGVITIDENGNVIPSVVGIDGNSFKVIDVTKE